MSFTFIATVSTPGEAICDNDLIIALRPVQSETNGHI